MDEGHEAELIREIETRLSEALSRFGVAGEIRIEAGRVVLRGAGVTVGADGVALIGQWDQLSADARQRACTDLVRRLVSERRASREPLAEPGANRYVWAGIVGIGLVALVGLLLGRPYWSGRGADSDSSSSNLRRRDLEPVAGSAGTGEQDREARAARVCQATVERVSRGGTVGTTDTEGWVVELTLLSNRSPSALTSHPALASYVARAPGAQSGRFVWAEAPELSRIEGPSTRVEVRAAGVHGPAAPAWHGVSLTFTGRYVRPYFDPAQRVDYLRVAHALADRLGATHAGLYARCASGKTHHLGAWFKGASASDATAALVYFMGAFATRPQVSVLELDAERRVAGGLGQLMQTVAEQTRSLSRDHLARVLGAEDGMITGPKEGPAIITFPFRDGNRATRVSHHIATFLGLASAP